MEMDLIDIARHRNGVDGLGFYVVLFRWKDTDAKKPRRMVASVFPDGGVVSVFDIDELNTENIRFAEGNSWRGDYFEPTLRQWIQTYDNRRRDCNIQWE